MNARIQSTSHFSSSIRSRHHFDRNAHPRSSIVPSAIKLYTNPGSRGKIAEWVLAELKLDYSTVLLDMRKGEHKQPSYLAINPWGKVPGLEDGDLKLFESGAILLHLASKYGNLSQDQLSKAMQWSLFANSTMSPAFFNNRSQMGEMLMPLDAILSSSAYLDGPEFSMGDVAVGAYLLYLPLFFPDMFTSDGFASKYPHVWKYMMKLSERQTCPEAYKEGMAVAKEASSGSAKSNNPLSGLFGKK